MDGNDHARRTLIAALLLSLGADALLPREGTAAGSLRSHFLPLCEVNYDLNRLGPVYAAWDWVAQRGGRMSRTGWRGGTSPSGRSGRKVVQGSSSSSAQSMFLAK